MKQKLRLMVFFLALFCGQSGYAQLTIDNDQEVFIDMEDGVEHFGYFHVSNNSGTTIDWEWKTLNNTLNNDWKIQFCECSSCYTNEFGSLPNSKTCFGIGDGSSQEWKLGLDKNGKAFSEEKFEVEIWDKTNNVRDTLTFKTRLFNSVHNISDSERIAIYPNPAKNSINIDASELQTVSDVEVDIYDLTGRVVLRKSLTKSLESIGVDHLPNGVYVLQINQGSRSAAIERIVINH